MIQTVRGNLLEKVSKGIIVHGVNAQGVMGSGIALSIKNQYPKAYQDYVTHHQSHKLKLGDVVFSEINNNLVVCNAVTQQFYGKDKKKYVSEEAVKLCFEKINEFAHHALIEDIHFPLIGCGLGGGEWTIIGKIIDDSLSNDLRKVLWVL